MFFRSTLDTETHKIEDTAGDHSGYKNLWNLGRDWNFSEQDRASQSQAEEMEGKESQYTNMIPLNNPSPTECPGLDNRSGRTV